MKTVQTDELHKKIEFHHHQMINTPDENRRERWYMIINMLVRELLIHFFKPKSNDNGSQKSYDDTDLV